MEEQKLSFHQNDDETLVVLNDERKTELLKEIKDLYFSTGELHARLKDGTLEVGLSQTLTSLMESYVVKILKSLNYDSVLKTEMEERHAKIRELNMQNHELRKQLGEKCSPEDVRECLKNMKEKISDWWNKEGFGYVPETVFHPYVCSIRLSGMMSIHYEKTQPEYLKNKGYEVIEPEKECFYLAHSEKNINLLISEVQKRFPSSKLSKIELSDYHSLHIKDAEFVIRNFDDI